jgi:hypothetical protein
VWGQAVTDKLNATWQDPLLRAQQHMFFLEVKGSGDAYGGWVEVDYLGA